MMKNNSTLQKLFRMVLIAFILKISMPLSHSIAAPPFPCKPPEPYVAPPFAGLSNDNESPLPSKLIDNRDGTISDPESGLLWTQKDSYADLKKCLTWPQALDYVESLKTGGYQDWRMPTVKELFSIYDDTRENILAWDSNPEYPLALDEVFSKGAAYWYWSNECGETETTKCCAKSVYFVRGHTNLRHFDQCNNGGVRAVRELP